MQSAQEILDTSTLLVKEDCLIVDGVLYEDIRADSAKHEFRFFFSDDDYDYVEDKALVDKLRALFGATPKSQRTVRNVPI